MNSMTPRERMMVALKNQQPDRIPVAPDISNMIPCRLTGKPYWDVYVENNPPLWKAYIEAIKYYGIDGWFTYGELKYKTATPVEIESRVIRKTDGFWEVKNIYHTPEGDLSEIMVSPKDNAPTFTEKIIKDFKEDFKKIKCLFSEITGYDKTLFEEQKKELGELGIMCIPIDPPGLQSYVDFFNGNLEAATYALYDYPELFEELCEIHGESCLKKLEMAIDAGVDSILTGGSGSITLQSPELWRKMSLPTMKKMLKMCKEAGVISGIHSCGKEFYVIETCANETDLNYINPLEVPPMGDCDLRDCKEKFGGKVALMGNIHTIEVMLYGTPDDVKRECLKAILAAGKNGGFVLSTADQCGRDTPDANIFTMVQTAKEFGQYPLDYDRIKNELDKLL